MPQWKNSDGHHTSSPFNYTRKADAASGRLFWVDEAGNEVVGPDGGRIWDTNAFW
ncbi:hypothetical protein SPI_03796 [Niveomyces insectorum RCEF 264]|uniref:Uncharacterized protein n=1 Tax=Niveomyces insectorum RCEF 264 TaxID=1081102 RepID=A0A167WD28_9HYPO|nr:hypothetical protein SPI_03796 [Niveomyces insectorum RCEF 264]